jgi:peptidyl-prolyl cis-trans isomerase D
LIKLDRATASQNQTVSPDVLNQLFSAKMGDSFIGQDVQFGFVVAKVTAIRAGDLSQAAQIAEAQRPQLTMQMYEEIGQLSRKSARTTVKVKTDIVRAKTVLGFAPEETKGVVDDTKKDPKAK